MYYNTKELQQAISLHAEVTVDCGEIISDWRTSLSKYSKFPGIHSFHDFVFVRRLVSHAVVSKVRKLCHVGAFEKSAIKIQAGRNVSENVIPGKTDS